MPEDVFKMPQVFGTLLFLNCVGSSLLSMVQLWTTVETEALLLTLQHGPVDLESNNLN